MKDAVKATAAYGGQLVESRFFDVAPSTTGWLTANAAAARALVARRREGGMG